MRNQISGALLALACVLPVGAGAALAASHSTPVTIKTAKIGSLGTILVNGSGFTLYRFTSDKKGSASCTGGCAAVWPPFLSTGKATAGPGVAASKLGTIKLPNGRKQVSYGGYALYQYKADTKPGSIKGEGIGGSWFAVTASGGLAKLKTGSGAGGGYKYGRRR